MKLTFWGAAEGNVTGSMHELESGGKRFLLDCGMYQGRRAQAAEQNRHFPFAPASVDAVILSHAHIDHSGNLPLLVKNGFRGPIYATAATADLCDPMLRDTAKIQVQDVEFLRKHHRPAADPLYDMGDVETTLPLFCKTGYRAPAAAGRGLDFEFFDAGHILGSASMVLDGPVRLAFSGDVGRPGLPIVRDPERLPPADYLIVESTYGDRLHKDEGAVADELAELVNRVVGRGGRIIVPAFAVGRAQQLVLLLHELINANRLPPVPIFVDSPLAVNVTRVFRAHPECFDEETRQYLDNGEDPFGFKRLQYVRDVEDSKKLNTLPGPFVVISPSGMCEAGRVLHHLSNNIEDPRNLVLITGYQAENTLGRKLLDGMKEVKIFGEMKQVRAELASLSELSAHADRAELLAWMEPMASTLKRVFLVHGEGGPEKALTEAIEARYKIDTVTPRRGQTFELP